MPIEIGSLIRKEIKRQGLNAKDLGRLINRHPKTIANILGRKTIDTQLLISICKALNHDFFKYYYDEEPLRLLKELEMKEIDQEISQLKSEVINKNEYILTQNKYVQSQEEVIRLLKEKENFLVKKA